jgi:hypothetical protein
MLVFDEHTSPIISDQRQIWSSWEHRVVGQFNEWSSGTPVHQEKDCYAEMRFGE